MPKRRSRETSWHCSACYLSSTGTARSITGTPANQKRSLIRTYPNIMQVCKPLMDAHGITLSSKIRARCGWKDRGCRPPCDHVEHHHKMNPSFHCPAIRPDRKVLRKDGVHRQQYGMRYNAIALLNIISEDPRDRDHDGHPGKFVPSKGGGFAEVPAEQPKITTAQRDKIADLMIAAKIKELQFCTKYGISQVGFLPADLFDAAVKAIADHVEAAKAANRG